MNIEDQRAALLEAASDLRQIALDIYSVEGRTALVVDLERLAETIGDRADDLS